jgi:hypothetical protein
MSNPYENDVQPQKGYLIMKRCLPLERMQNGSQKNGNQAWKGCQTPEGPPALKVFPTLEVPPALEVLPTLEILPNLGISQTLRLLSHGKAN